MIGALILLSEELLICVKDTLSEEFYLLDFLPLHPHAFLLARTLGVFF